MAQSRTNWSRGLFRLWVIVAVLWAIGAFLVLRPDRELAAYARDLQRINTARSDVAAIPTDATDAEESEKLQVVGNQLILDRAKAENTSEPVMHVFVPAEPSQDPNLEAWRTLVATEMDMAKDRASARLANSGFALGATFGPMLALLVVGASFFWALLGFRRESG